MWRGGVTKNFTPLRSSHSMMSNIPPPSTADWTTVNVFANINDQTPYQDAGLDFRIESLL